MATRIATVNIGATHIRSTFWLNDKMGLKVDEPTTRYKPTVDQIVRFALETGATALAVCVAGNVVNGTVIGAGNLGSLDPQWIEANLQDDLHERLGFPVQVVNDAHAEAIGEASARTEEGTLTPITYIGWGSGIGVATTSGATEAGHMILSDESLLVCGCGGVGCAEALIGGNNLEARFGVPVEEMSPMQWDQTIPDLSRLIRNLMVAFLGNRLVVIGGGVALRQLDDERLAWLKQRLQWMPTTVPMPGIELARHGDDAALYGLYALALRGGL